MAVTQVMEDGSSDVRSCIGTKGNTSRFAVQVCCSDQSESPDLDEVIHVDVGSQDVIACQGQDEVEMLSHPSISLALCCFIGVESVCAALISGPRFSDSHRGSP